MVKVASEAGFTIRVVTLMTILLIVSNIVIRVAPRIAAAARAALQSRSFGPAQPPAPCSPAIGWSFGAGLSSSSRGIVTSL